MQALCYGNLEKGISPSEFRFYWLSVFWSWDSWLSFLKISVVFHSINIFCWSKDFTSFFNYFFFLEKSPLNPQYFTTRIFFSFQNVSNIFLILNGCNIWHMRNNNPDPLNEWTVRWTIKVGQHRGHTTHSWKYVDPLPQLKGKEVHIPTGPSAPKIIRPYWLFVYMPLVPYKGKLGKGIKISPGKLVLFQKTQR